MLQNLLADTEYLVDSAEPIVKWLSIGLVIALVLAGIVLFFVKRDAVMTYVKWAILGFFIYALVIGILMLILEIVKEFSTTYSADNWLDREATISYLLVPLLVFFAVTLASTFAILASKMLLPKAFKPTLITCVVLSAASLVAALVFMGIYFADTIGDSYGDVNQPVLYIGAAVLIALVIILAFVCDKGKKGFDTRSISYAAVCIAMSYALSYVTLFSMPQGGSITFASLLPLMVYSYMFGTKKGVLACFIYGALDAINSAWLIHPAQFLLDYPVAYSFIGLAGMFANVKSLDKLPQVKFALGAVVASVFRYISHVISGVFAFFTWAPDGMSPWAYSLAYNSFVFVDILIVIIAGVFVFSSKTFVKQVDSYRLANNK